MEDQMQAVALLHAYRAEIERITSWGLDLKQVAALSPILKADAQTRLAVLCIALSERQTLRNPYSPSRPRPYHLYHAYYHLISHLCKSRLPYTEDTLHTVLQTLAREQYLHCCPVQAVLRTTAYALRDPALLAACRADLEHLREHALSTWYPDAARRKFVRLLDELLAGQQRMLTIFPDAWGTQVTALLQEMEPDLQVRWVALLQHCAASSGAVPKKQWLAQLPTLLDAVGRERFVRLVLPWLDAFGKQRDERLDEANADLVRGLAWCCADFSDTSLASALADAAIEGYRKISGLGPRSVKIASTCVYALKHMPELQGAAQLARVHLNVKQPAYQRDLETALTELAKQAGMSREDLEELTMPSFDLDQGKRRQPIGSFVAEIQVTGTSVRIQWYDASGRPRKAEPADIKREHQAERAELKRLRDDLARMLAAQRDRLERLPLLERTWPLAAWRARYLDHPLVGTLARRLLWRFTDGERIQDGIWLDGQLVDVNDRPLHLSESTRVSAWHPLFCDAQVVRAWRTWLEQHQVTQPFKQAHREVYRLTDAERTTRTYSNRFAAHILRQHQFHALATARGWRNQLRLLVDDSYLPPMLELPHWGLRAEFWVEGAGSEYGIDTNETGTYLYLATDQVRFYQMNAAYNQAHAGGGGYTSTTRWIEPEEPETPPLPLEQVPALVFSEVLRDVDLFVGVASVGNDPTWHDGAHQGRYQDYWQSFSFGALSATAQARKDLLERLLPRLAIAERCSIEGRFLRVRGDLRTYKIHLGSSNILMEPNDQYLCIVPRRGSAEATPGGMFLPFEGDDVFAIILSKALLLAEDRKITDPSITRQIKRR